VHILLIHQAFAALDEAGGTRHYEMASYLVKHGHRVTIIASPVSYLTGQSSQRHSQWVTREVPQAGITILRSYTYTALHRSFVHRVFSFLSFMISSFINGLGVKNVDMVWGTTPPIFQGVTAWLLARIKGVPFLFEVRDLWPEFAIAVGVLKNPLLIKLSLWLEGFLYRRANRIMVNSPGFIQHVTGRGARWVELVPNGADPSMFDPSLDGAEFREKHQLADKFIILYAGAHGLSNDLDVILEAARLTREDEQIMYVFIGAGKEKDRLIHKASEMKLSNILFLPPVAKAGMSQALASADACVAILKPLDWYKTTYPNKVFDYMAAGRPVLLLIDGVIRQVVEEAQAGFFISPGDAAGLANAAVCLKNDPKKGKEMGVAGRACIEKQFSRDQLSEKLEMVLLDMEKHHA
jgi:glycosyltransferase involved in cell wall biosynthesis